MCKYVFCDLDYTLLDDNKNISLENIKAIKDFEDKGNHFVICTGRVPYVMKKYSDLLGSKDIVCANGGILIIDNKQVKSSFLEKEIIEAVLNYVIQNNLYARIFSPERLYILNRPADDPLSTQLFDGFKFIDKDDIQDLINNIKIIKIIICDDDANRMHKTEKYISGLNLNIELTYSAACFLEVNREGQRKGNGIIEFCKLKNIDIKDTISIGDNDNDISMFETTKYSACPSNAIDKVKQIVDYISPKDYKNSAVADILKHFENYEK